MPCRISFITHLELWRKTYDNFIKWIRRLRKNNSNKKHNKKYGDTWFAYSTIKLSREIECLSPCCFHEWWFNTSKCEEFCDEIYSSIKAGFSNLRNDAILDKGIATFDARVWATLVIKGLSKKDAYELLQKKRSSTEFRYWNKNESF